MREDVKLAILGLLVVAALGLIALIACSPAFAVPAAISPRRQIVQEAASPSGAHVAVLVDVSGGGAAGYQYQEVVLRSRAAGKQFMVATRLYAAALRWRDDTNLEVTRSSGEAGSEEVDGVAIRYPSRTK